MVKGIILEDTEFKGNIIPKGSEVEIIGSTFSNLYPTKFYRKIKHDGMVCHVKKELIRITSSY